MSEIRKIQTKPKHNILVLYGPKGEEIHIRRRPIGFQKPRK